MRRNGVISTSGRRISILSLRDLVDVSQGG